MKGIKCYSGMTVLEQAKENYTGHPTLEVEAARRIIYGAISIDEEVDVYSNHPDFVSAIKYIAEKLEVPTEFFLDGVSQGSEIDDIFGDMNKAFDLINTYSV